jgi:carboxypeptidase C (cathepsin A)
MWLHVTDLVFVDPVGTGFSRGDPDDSAADKYFYGFSIFNPNMCK